MTLIKDIDTKALSKQYYMIGEVADMFDLPQSVVRAWEKEIGHYHPKKNRAGDRMFTPADIEKVRQVYFLIKIKKFTVAGARQYLKENRNFITEKNDLKSRLLKLKSNFVQLKLKLK